MASISLKNLYKSYESTANVVKNVSLDIHDKEFIIFVGPSGCGKSTTLRMIAGLEDITDGQIYIGDACVNDVAPNDRDIAMVFQNYALYPNMNVYKNLSFSLRLKKVNKKEIDVIVHDIANVLGITDLLNKKPKELSGGQRQRVALGRAMVRSPKVFLLDEPLSNLDAKLRAHMRVEISKLHKKLDATFVYVTHDQVEAMTMADRIVVMNDGIIQQVDTPANIYNNPANMFVAGFIGMPQINFMDAILCFENDKYYAKTNDSKIEIAKVSDDMKNYIDKEVVLGIRPENFEVSDSGEYEYDIDICEMMGSENIVHLSKGDVNIVLKISSNTNIAMKKSISFNVMSDKIHVFDKESQMKIN